MVLVTTRKKDNPKKYYEKALPLNTRQIQRIGMEPARIPALCNWLLPIIIKEQQYGCSPLVMKITISKIGKQSSNWYKSAFCCLCFICSKIFLNMLQQKKLVAPSFKYYLTACTFSLLFFSAGAQSQAIDTAAEKNTIFSGSLVLSSNGFSIVPTFSLNNAAAMFLL